MLAWKLKVELNVNLTGLGPSRPVTFAFAARSLYSARDEAILLIQIQQIRVHQKRKKKKITLKSGRVFFGNPQHDIILSYCESEFEPLFQLQQPCSHKKTQKLVAVLLSLYSSKYFLFPFGLCFQFFFFWAKMLHYFLGHLEEVRSYMAMKMKPSSGESGLLISEWKSKTHNKCMAFEIRGPHGRALADRLCHGAWVVRLRGLLKKASTGRN